MTKAKTRRLEVKKLRVLVLVHADLVPPDSLDGHTDKEILEWKCEYDVVTALRKMGHDVRPLGVSDDLGKIRKEESALWNGEHAGAYIATLAATAFGVLTLLIGFNVISEDHTFYDGMTWGALGVLSAFLAGALHSVSHHQPAYDWDEVRILIEERVASGGMNVPGRTEPGRERR